MRIKVPGRTGRGISSQILLLRKGTVHVWLFLAIVLGLSVCKSPAFGQTAQGTRATSRFEKQMKDLEDRRFRALEQNDFGALESILADDMQYTHSDGRLESKEEYLKSLRTGHVKYMSIALEGSEVRGYGSTAVVTGRALFRVRHTDGERSQRLRYTDVYVKRKGRWQLVAWQATRLNP